MNLNRFYKILLLMVLIWTLSGCASTPSTPSPPPPPPPASPEPPVAEAGEYLFRQEAYNAIIQMSHADPFTQTGGFLGGVEKDKMIEEVIEVKKISPAPDESYLRDPEQLQEIIEMFETKGMDLIGAWHSHPEPYGNSQPSYTDLDNQYTFWDNRLTLIYGVTSNKVRIYRIPTAEEAASDPYYLMAVHVPFVVKPYSYPPTSIDR
jgi:proteasome lid subunit RPN8/RPN11